MGGFCSKRADVEKGKAIMEGEGTVVHNSIHAAAQVQNDTQELSSLQIQQRKQITQIYKYYKGVESLSELPLLFEKFNGKEDIIILDLERQYPATKRASQAVSLEDMYGQDDAKKENEEMRASTGVMSEFRDSSITKEVWLYLDDTVELGPFDTREMISRLRSGVYKNEMPVKQSHWTEFHALQKIWPNVGDEWTYSPPEPGTGLKKSPSMTSSTAGSMPSIKGMPPRPVGRKGSILPTATSGAMQQLPKAAPAISAPDADASSANSDRLPDVPPASPV